LGQAIGGEEELGIEDIVEQNEEGGELKLEWCMMYDVWWKIKKYMKFKSVTSVCFASFPLFFSCSSFHLSHEHPVYKRWVILSFFFICHTNTIKLKTHSKLKI
jgi:hypothetical protein